MGKVGQAWRGRLGRVGMARSGKAKLGSGRRIRRSELPRVYVGEIPGINFGWLFVMRGWPLGRRCAVLRPGTGEAWQGRRG